MRKKTLRIVVEIAIIIFIIEGFVIINDLISDFGKKKFKPIVDNNKYAYQVEELVIEDDEIVLKGWFFELKNVRNEDQHVDEGKELGIVLFDNSIKIENPKDFYKGISMSVTRNTRNDVNNYFNCEYDYSYCGFTAKIPKNNIELDQKEYRIIFKPDINGEVGILSQVFIRNETINYIPADEYVDLDISGTDLEIVVNEGYCIGGNPEKKLAIFQYEWKLYWILDSEIYSSKKEKSTMQFRIDTTQYNKLNENNMDNREFWNKLDFTFEKAEISDSINCGKYRVCVQDIPDDISVSWILNRFYYENKQVYEKGFRPIYNFYLNR